MNAFDALCVLASAEGWCWKYPCSTCANMEFRYGYLELSQGKHPQDQNWIMTQDDITNGKVYEFPYKFPFEYPLEDREAVLKICLESNLSVINDTCKFPDWLGYIGLILRYMDSWREPSKLYEKVSEHWAKQLMEIIPKTSTAYSMLESKGSLNFYILEACERVLNGTETKEIKRQEENRIYNESIAYESLLKIVENPGRPYSSDVAVYARQEDVDRLSDEQYEKLCKMYVHLSENADTPWANFKARFLNGRQ